MMKKNEWWPWVICAVAAVIGGFREGGGEVVFADGHKASQPAFNVVGAVVYFFLAWGAVVVVGLIWESAKKHVIDEYEQSQEAVADDPSPARATPASSDEQVCDFKVGDIVRYVHGGREFAVTQVDGHGFYVLEADGGSHVAVATNLTLADRQVP